jgi:hypothetical protein
VTISTAPEQQRRAHGFVQEEERDGHRDERRHAEDHRDARRARVADRDRDENLRRAGRQETREQERPSRVEMQPARRRLAGRRDDATNESRSRGGKRAEGGVRVAVERHPQRHAHRAEEERREEREPDGGYTASSAPSGGGLPRENSGMNTCASGPIDSA